VPHADLASDAFVTALLGELAAAGIDPTRWVLASARLIPSLVLIPTFGLQAFPFTLRLAFAFMLGACIAPGLVPLAAGTSTLLGTLGAELARGLPVALSVAVSVWGASMAGELLDAVRGSSTASRAVFDGGAASPLAVLLSLAVGVAFFQLGGPARLADALATAPPFAEQDVRSIALSIARGIQFSVLLAGPLLALVPFLELLHALVARVSQPIGLGAVLGPVKAVTLLGVTALLLDRIATAAVLWLDRALPS
jgi:type III secretory pathway component EscT